MSYYSGYYSGVSEGLLENGNVTKTRYGILFPGEGPSPLAQLGYHRVPQKPSFNGA